jgi:hypothetical protein
LSRRWLAQSNRETHPLLNFPVGVTIHGAMVYSHTGLIAVALALDAHAPTDPDARSYAIKVRVADERLTVQIKSSLGLATPPGPAS